MTMTDPIADMLTRLRNANSAYHDSVAMPHSKIKAHIAEILQQEGYIAGWKVEDAEVGKSLVVDLKFGPNRERSIAGIKRISKPGLRVYAKSTTCRRSSGPGVAIISTSRSPDRQQAAEGRGWEVLAVRLVMRNGGIANVAYWQAAHPGSRGVDVTIDGRSVQVKGPKGSLSLELSAPSRSPRVRTAF
ncbi:hypothetical protein GCM10020221_07050 [Streptomyces thioluteus]|uniref:Small ribosomal subunit protein uS8 n=1 Tax=Streptomyces thioluteus TaxID=66431 RepID=A0ABN3WFV0_STRTU